VKQKLFLFLLFAKICAANAQIDSSFYKQVGEQISRTNKMVQSARSLDSTGRNGSLDSSIYKVADSIDKMHPVMFLTTVAEMLGSDHLNEAAFLYYTGRIRFGYYKAANPKYSASDDGALFASLHSMIGEYMDRYLRANINNYIAILQKSLDWCTLYDSPFFPKKNNTVKYNAQLKGIRSLIKDLSLNKDIYNVKWKAEEDLYRMQMDSLLQRK